MTNVNRKGVKGLIKIIDWLQDNGYYCFPAFDDHSPVDLIAMSDTGKTYRLQVKYKEDSYDLRTSSVVNGKRVEIDRTLIDAWAIYLPKEENKVIFIPVEFMEGKKSHKIIPTKDYGAWAGR